MVWLDEGPLADDTTFFLFIWPYLILLSYQMAYLVENEFFF